MFLYLLDFIFLIFVQDVPFKLKLIFLNFLDVAHAVVEVWWYEPLEVGHVHKLGLDCFYHFFIEIKFKHILVLFAQPNHCREQWFQGSCSWQLNQSPILAAGLKCLQAFLLNKQNVGYV